MLILIKEQLFSLGRFVGVLYASNENQINKGGGAPPPLPPPPRLLPPPSSRPAPPLPTRNCMAVRMSCTHVHKDIPQIRTVEEQGHNSLLYTVYIIMLITRYVEHHNMSVAILLQIFIVSCCAVESRGWAFALCSAQLRCWRVAKKQDRSGDHPACGVTLKV